MFRGRLATRLAVLAIPMTLGAVVGAEVSWAERGSLRVDDETCRNAVLAPLPISLCRVEP